MHEVDLVAQPGISGPLISLVDCEEDVWARRSTEVEECSNHLSVRLVEHVLI